MRKDIWSWVLQQQEAEKLGYLCKELNIQIPGFRKGTIPSALKAMVVTHLLKPKNLNRIAGTKINLYDGIEEKYPLVSMTKNELIEINDIPPSLILHKLLTEKETEKASQLFDNWIKEEGEDGLDLLEKERKSEMKKRYIEKEEDLSESSVIATKKDINTQIKAEERKLEKIQKKLESKIFALQEELKRVQADFTQYRESNNELKQEDAKVLQQLKSENGILLQKFNEAEMTVIQERRAWKGEKKLLLQTIDGLQKDKSKLNAALLKNQHTELITTSEIIPANKKKVIVIGNPHNSSIFKNCPIDVTVVERDQIEIVDLNQCEEIWVLAYKLDSQLIHDVRQKVNVHVKKIETFQQLKLEIEKGSDVNEKQKVGS